MTSDVMQKYRPLKHMLFIVLWLAGALFVYTRRYSCYQFLPMLYGWLLVGSLYWIRGKLGRWSIVAVFIIATLTCAVAGSLYAGYINNHYREGLDDFVTTAVKGTFSPEFSCPDSLSACRECDLSKWQSDFTEDYDIIATDTFGIERDWLIRFSNGVEYSVVLVPTSAEHWQVCARYVRRHTE